MNSLNITILHDTEPTAISSACALKSLLEAYSCVNVNEVAIPIGGCSNSHLKSLDKQGRIYDNIIAINWRRLDCGTAFNHKHTFVTWLQDETEWMYERDSHKLWNVMPHDWIIGYTGRVREIGYRDDHLIEMPFLVNRNIYSTNNENYKHISGSNNVDVVFAGNKGYDIEHYVVQELFPLCKAYHIPFNLMLNLVDKLKCHYKNGLKICGYSALNNFIQQECPDLLDILALLPAQQFKTIMNIYLYWGINEALYRQTVLEWIVDAGLSLKIAGYNWSNKSKLGKYCCGYIDNNQLPGFYRLGRYALHLNSFEGLHHRPTEILMSGASMIMRSTTDINRKIKPFNVVDYINTQTDLIDYMLDRIFNDNKNAVKPNTDKLYSTIDSAVIFDSKEELRFLFYR